MGAGQDGAVRRAQGGEAGDPIAACQEEALLPRSPRVGADGNAHSGGGAAGGGHPRRDALSRSGLRRAALAVLLREASARRGVGTRSVCALGGVGSEAAVGQGGTGHRLSWPVGLHLHGAIIYTIPRSRRRAATNWWLSRNACQTELKSE